MIVHDNSINTIAQLKYLISKLGCNSISQKVTNPFKVLLMPGWKQTLLKLSRSLIHLYLKIQFQLALPSHY